MTASSSSFLLVPLLLLSEALAFQSPTATRAYEYRSSDQSAAASASAITASTTRLKLALSALSSTATTSSPPPTTSDSNTTIISSNSNKNGFDSFSYTSQWYPVIWSQDVPLNQPVRVTLFDVDYVLAKTTSATTTSSSATTTASSSSNSSSNNGSTKREEEEEEEVYYAMVDRCPHKKVALSEGRITDCGSKRYLQCSYHGWAFDGETGQCMEIPQTVIAQKSQNSANDVVAKPSTKKRREDATAIAVHEVQGMIWLQPSYTPLEALAAMQEGTLLPPPRIPELDMEGYRATCAVRDFPIDWTVLMENIMDPDHGYFAHSSSGASKGFDLYAADGVENVVQVDEEITKGGGWKITNSVNAVEKLIDYNKNVRSATVDTENTDNKEESKDDLLPPKLAITTYVAPSLIYMGRRTNSTSPAGFVTGFWVCPTGTGKSRFMSAAIGKTPFSIPRWMVHINLNNFLDQDTFLLCGQHRAVLEREAKGYLEQEGDEEESMMTNNVRKSTYVYRSPSERMPVRIGQFFDATLSRVPNRKEGVLNWYGKNANNHKLLEPWTSREEVLDRYEQHTKICPDSMDVVKQCTKIMNSSKMVGLGLIFMKMILTRSSVGGPMQVSLSNPFVAGFGLAAIRQLFTQSVSIISSVANRIVAILLRDKIFYSILAIAFLSHSIASRIKREFFFKFDEELHRKDIKYIAKNWVDL